jgi:MYXO-CTERM domain-containing protein
MAGAGLTTSGSKDSGGCGCRAAGAPVGSTSSFLGLALGLLALGRRRRPSAG